MDRRRILLLIFVTLVVVAAGDIYVNKLNLIEHFAQGFTFEIEGSEPQRTVERTVTHDAAGIERLLMEQEGGVIIVSGDSTDQITVTSTVEIFAANDEAAEAFANSLSIELDANGGTIEPKLSGGQRDGIRRVNTRWDIRIPQHLAVEIENRLGSIVVGDVAAPVELRGSGAMEVVSIAGPVTVHNGLGMVKVQGVLGDTFVESSIGSVELANISGNVELVTSTSESRVRDVNGQVTVEGSLGSVQIERADGDVRVRYSGTGYIAARDVRSRVDIQAEIGNVVIQPSMSAPIDATVAQGNINLIIPRGLLAEYQFDLDAEEIMSSSGIEPFDASQGEPIDAHLVKATVRKGEINVSLTN